MRAGRGGLSVFTAGTRVSQWIDVEPADDLRKEIAYLLRRARTRPLAPALLALGFALSVIAWRASSPPRHESTVVLAATEGTLDLATAPRQIRALRSHVESALLSDARLTDVMVRHDLYATERQRGASLALSTFRDDLDVRVWRNYFLEARDAADDPGRSTRLSITWRAADPELALAVTQELAHLIIDAEEEGRADDAARALSGLTEALAARQVELARAGADFARAQTALDEQASPAHAIALASRRTALTRAQEDLAAVARHRNALALRLRLEQRRMGLRFEIVDEGRLDTARWSRPVELGLLGAIALAFALPLAALTLAAFDARVHRQEDLRRLGFVALGQLPPAR